MVVVPVAAPVATLKHSAEQCVQCSSDARLGHSTRTQGKSKWQPRRPGPAKSPRPFAIMATIAGPPTAIVT